MALRLPSNTMVPSPVPLPTRKLTPLRLPRVSRPLLAVRVTRIVPPPTSTSAIDSALPLPVLNTRALSRNTFWVPGTLLTGASLTAVTVRVTVVWSVWVPPLPVLPPSSMVTSSTTLLVALAAVV